MEGFKFWLLSENDIFGFERGKLSKNDRPARVMDAPVVPINTEVVVNALMKMEVSNQEPFSEFLDEIQWGRDVGAVKMVISPLGSFKSIVRKLSTDLEGNKVWVCKKILPYNDLLHVTQAFDENIALEVIKHIESVANQETESPRRDYNELEKLTKRVTSLCRRSDVLPEAFIFKGVKQIKKNENYLIYFECAGHGVETPNSGRLEQFIIDMSYNRKTGMIRSFGHDVQSRVRQHVWIPQPSEWDEYFSPVQPEEEIANCIGAALSTY